MPEIVSRHELFKTLGMVGSEQGAAARKEHDPMHDENAWRRVEDASETSIRIVR